MWANSAYFGNPTTNGGQDPSSLLRSSRLEVNDISLRTLGAFEPVGDYATMKEQFFTTSPHIDICLQSRRVQLYTAGDEDAAAEETNTSHHPIPTITTDEVVFNVSVRAFYVALKATLYFVKLVKLFKVEPKHETAPVVSDEGHAATVLAQVTVDRLIVYLVLPEEVPLRISLDGLDFRLDASRGAQVATDTITVEVSSNDDNTVDNSEYATLVELEDATVDIRNGIDGDVKPHKIVSLGIADIRVFVPHAFKVSNVIENAINMQKAIKELCRIELGTRASSSTSSRGRTRINPGAIPTVRVAIDNFTMQLEDDPFESILSRNYHLGMEEQEGRLARDKAFQNKAAALRAIEEKRFGSIVMGARQSPEVENAWWMLQEFDSRAWIDRMRKTKAHAPSGFPALLNARFANLTVVLTRPVLPAETVEESLNVMDPTTPPDALYAELIPRNINVSLAQLSMQIRDYAYPLVYIPSKWTTEGLIILAEQALQPESQRTVLMPLDLPDRDHIVVSRAVNPTKLYTSFNTTITSDTTTQVCWGASTEPGIADMMGVFDTFTRPNVDPSVPIGWWDKLRLIMHGHNAIHITGGGDVKFRILGSSSPYFDGRKHWGTEGMTISLKDGVRIDVNGSSVPGEDVTIEAGELALSLPSMKPQQHASNAEDTITCFKGGVKISLGFDFFTQRSERKSVAMALEKEGSTLGNRKNHAELCLRAPEFCSVDELKRWDSFRGFRTHSIHVTINIESPRPFYASLPEPLNSLSLTMETLSRFFTFTQVYQSPLTSLPIRRGKLFQEAGPGPSKQKLGRVISSIRLITCIYPLLAGFVAEPRERNWGVGMRIRAEQMNMDMTLVQRVIRQRRPKEELLKRKSATKWLLSTSEIELKEVEARAIAYGNIDEAKRENEGNAAAAAAKDQDGAGPGHGHPTADDLEDHDWYFASDYSRSTEEGAECNINMVPFAWAPRIIYFKRNEVNTSLAHDNIRARRDIYSVQKTLFKSRMREIESSIRHYLDVQKGLEYRMAVFFDDSLRQQSQIIVEKMAVLHEKKVVIDKYIRGCQKKMDSAAHLDLTGTGRAEAKLPPSALFKHHFIVHNVNLLWKKDVRNILFQMISLQQRRLAIKYCLSNTATRVMSQLVASVAERRVGIDPMMDFDPDRPPEPSKAAHHHSSPTPVINKSSTMEVVNMTPTGAHRLLSKLVDEMTSSFMVPNEMDVEEETASTGVGRDSTADYNSSDHKTTTFASSKKAYVASRDPESPDYVADNQTFESEYIVQLIHPQVNLEAESKDDPAHLESVVVAAESMQLRSVLILDARASSSQAPADENSDRNEEIIKSRMILNIEDAQLFVARLVDFVTAPEFDLDNIVMHRQQGHDFHNNNSTSTTSTPWPVWVPIECLIDHSSHSGHLQRVVERTSASFYRDLPNPLYLKGDNAMNDPESMQQLHMNFPNFAISANATQYMVIYDVIENLLVYRDPVKGEHAEKLKKMLLVLEQMEDLRKVQETVIALQQKIRNADAFLRCGNVLDGPTAAAAAAGSASASTSSPPTHSDEVIAARKLEIMRHLAQYQDELIIIINALKAMQMLEQKKNSAAVSLQTSLRVDKLVWCMIHDDNNPLCEWVLDKAQFSWTQHEDQSSINTLHIDQLHLENHLQAHNSFKEVIAPYTPDKRDVDFTRHKMIRVYLREMAPVAGIKVVDHFEVNIFPLLIQVTYDMVKEIIYYLFPEKKAGAKEHSSNSGASGTGSGSISHVNSASSSSATAAGSYAGIEPKRFPRSDSVDQLTVRSAKSSHSEPSATAIMLRRQSSVSLEVADNVSISATSSRASSVSEGDGSSPLLDRKRIFKTSAFSAYGHQRTGSSRSENNKEDDHDTVTSASTTGGPSTANAGNSNNNPSPKLARAAAARKITKVNELKQMQARASSNRSFIYIKMPGGQHCLSYRGSKEKNIEDLFMFAFKMPTLEFRNKTWTWLDFLDAVKKEALRAVLANTGALVREKLFQKRKPEQQQIQNQQANETAPATGGMLAPRLLPHPGPTASTATITTSTTTTSSASFSSASASAPATQTRQSKFNRSMFGKRSSSKDPSEREREKDKDKDKDRDKDINSNSNNDKPISYSSAATSKKDHHHHQYPHQVVPLQPLHEEDKKMNQRRKEKGQQAVHQPSTELLFDLGDEDG
ncbi:golgi-body localization protein domain-containing protein [Powellomyces hirtus]|nr:golgi-body localization protein domain-containing protein [Powellomyces hirtus]